MLEELAEKTDFATEEEKVGFHIMARALQSPARQIAANANYEPSVVINDVLSHKDNHHGFNAMTGKVENLIKSGIIDPKKVTRSALENAASIAGVFLTAEAAVVSVPQSDDAHGGSQMPGGMGGMGMM